MSHGEIELIVNLLSSNSNTMIYSGSYYDDSCQRRGVSEFLVDPNQWWKTNYGKSISDPKCVDSVCRNSCISILLTLFENLHYYTEEYHQSLSKNYISLNGKCCVNEECQNKYIIDYQAIVGQLPPVCPMCNRFLHPSIFYITKLVDDKVISMYDYVICVNISPESLEFTNIASSVSSHHKSLIHISPYKYHYLAYLQLKLSLDAADKIMSQLHIIECVGNVSQILSVILITIRDLFALDNKIIYLPIEAYHPKPVKQLEDCDSSMEKEIGDMLEALSKSHAKPRFKKHVYPEYVIKIPTRSIPNLTHLFDQQDTLDEEDPSLLLNLASQDK